MKHFFIGFLTAIMAFVSLIVIDVINDIFFHIPLQLQYATNDIISVVLRSMFIVALVEEGIRFWMITKSMSTFGIGNTLRQRVTNGFFFASGFMGLEIGFALLNPALSAVPLIFMIFPFMIHLFLSIIFYLLLPIVKQRPLRFLLLFFTIIIHTASNYVILVTL